MTLKEKQLEFIIYCIENIAERLGRYSADAVPYTHLYPAPIFASRLQRLLRRK